MPAADSRHLYPVEKAARLRSRWRRLMQNPERILGPYLRPGMTVLDLGCGPGFFTLAAARLVGPEGTVIAVDLQPGMLELVGKFCRDERLAERVVLHQCEENRLGVTRAIDGALAFHVIHELARPEAYIGELAGIVRPGGFLLVAEPRFVVSAPRFAATIELLRRHGFAARERSKGLFSRGAVLSKG